MTSEDEVRAASEAFYGALNRMLNGDPGALRDIWSQDPTVSTMHPVGGREIGWDQVGRSWTNMAKRTTDGKVTLSDRYIACIGNAAYELGVEHADFSLAGERIIAGCRVTNIYSRESGTWKLVHHHADLSPAMMDVLSQVGGRA